jgi:hypothetical protein
MAPIHGSNVFPICTDTASDPVAQHPSSDLRDALYRGTRRDSRWPRDRRVRSLRHRCGGSPSGARSPSAQFSIEPQPVAQLHERHARSHTQIVKSADRLDEGAPGTVQIALSQSSLNDQAVPLFGP